MTISNRVLGNPSSMFREYILWREELLVTIYFPGAGLPLVSDEVSRCRVWLRHPCDAHRGAGQVRCRGAEDLHFHTAKKC